MNNRCTSAIDMPQTLEVTKSYYENYIENNVNEPFIMSKTLCGIPGNV
ncbi:MAG: hypothetical protein Q4B63_05165 [Clostridium perfringens]|nr:hypothetical protein [Clostridium perfringens]